jgi:hypothetical protein
LHKLKFVVNYSFIIFLIIGNTEIFKNNSS